jgi:hypothetical protein
MARAAVLAALLVFGGCGVHRHDAVDAYRSCLDRLGKVTSVGGQETVRFRDRTAVTVVITPTAEDAQEVAPLAAGPGDPYGYVAYGRAVIGWRDGPNDPHLRAVERCVPKR